MHCVQLTRLLLPRVQPSQDGLQHVAQHRQGRAHDEVDEALEDRERERERQEEIMR